MKGKKCHKSIALALLILLCLFLVNGCGSGIRNDMDDSYYERSDERTKETIDEYHSKADKVYQNTLKRIMAGDVEELEGTDIFDKANRIVLRGYIRAYQVIRGLTPVFIISSVSIGILMMVFARYNKQLMRLGLFAFILGIPMVLLLFVFGVGIINGIFLY